MEESSCRTDGMYKYIYIIFISAILRYVLDIGITVI
jgi:hypothetical protein